MLVESYSKSIPGSTHAYEDRILTDTSKKIYAVADGVTISSQGSGGVAAELAIRLLEQEYSGDIVAAVRMVHKRLLELKKVDRKIGETTLTVASIKDDSVEVANVGDSPACLIRGGNLMNLTTLDEDRVLGYLTQVLGYPAEVEVHHVNQHLLKGDCLIVASDGVEHVLKPEKILPLLQAGMTAEGMAQALLKEAGRVATGYDDDKSLIVMRVLEI